MYTDEFFMKKALRLARRGAGLCSPNPMVGAVVLDRKGLLVGEGFHRGPGQAHAEVVALDRAGDRARGGTLYVTLEPCNHWGRTPPCTDRILSSGIQTVVMAMRDPNPHVKGKGRQRVCRKGLQLREGVLESEAVELNRAFVKHATTGLPWFILKSGMTLDGKIATRQGHSRWITGPESRLRVHRMREESDAILTGLGTILQDDPAFTVRLPGRPERFKRVIVVDSQARCPNRARIFQSWESHRPPILATTSMARPSTLKAFERQGIEVLCLGRGPRVDLVVLAEALGDRGMNRILVEAGGTLNASMMESGLVDEYHFFVAPLIFGGAKAPSPMEGRGIETISEATRLQFRRIRRIGSDLWIEGRRGI
jgi:diaminohydroxyphosphoribosylaminopyrimidine deaminase/5-amino-6-(5-phosphoribosylamino)uracil reductase